MLGAPYSAAMAEGPAALPSACSAQCVEEETNNGDIIRLFCGEQAVTGRSHQRRPRAS